MRKEDLYAERLSEINSFAGGRHRVFAWFIPKISQGQYLDSATIYGALPACDTNFGGVDRVVRYQPSKLRIGVRFSYPAPKMSSLLT